MSHAIRVAYACHRVAYIIPPRSVPNNDSVRGDPINSCINFSEKCACNDISIWSILLRPMHFFICFGYISESEHNESTPFFSLQSKQIILPLLSRQHNVNLLTLVSVHDLSHVNFLDKIVSDSQNTVCTQSCPPRSWFLSCAKILKPWSPKV